MKFARLAMALVLAVAAPAFAQGVQRRELGNQIFENVPEAPQAVTLRYWVEPLAGPV